MATLPTLQAFGKYGRLMPRGNHPAHCHVMRTSTDARAGPRPRGIWESESTSLSRSDLCTLLGSASA
eukprot:2368108-Prorocentrum_lima.AAC.1